MPLKPPMTNIETNARAKHIGVVNRIDPPHTVPIQLKVLIAEGTAITIVENENVAESMRFIPLTNIWWPQTMNPSPPMAISAKTIALYPKIGLRENTDRISEAKPMDGRMRM